MRLHKQSMIRLVVIAVVDVMRPTSTANTVQIVSGCSFSGGVLILQVVAVPGPAVVS
jgi:hypothetical protein